jgi:acyl-coenzyme A synthetase/AMP-(fatty) acid ligase
MTVLDPTSLADVFLSEKINAAFFSTALLKQSLEEIPSAISELDLLFAGGEKMRPRDAIKARELVRSSFCHVYGPTENTTFSTVYRMGGEERCINGVPIGRAISHSGAIIMDLHQRLIPLGVMGELVVTGDGLARGYTDPALDRNRFIQVTIDGQLVRAYRTGDRARYRPTDGQIEFFGRMDQQIKIRGHRIEPAEVEQAMLDHSAVRDAAVIVRNLEGQETEMVGFVVVRGDDATKHLESQEEQFLQTEKEIRNRLQTLLPPYMVPARIMVLDQMPLNANGKVDRKELDRRAQTAPRREVAAARVAPRNEVEATLCEEFADVLGAEVGITDNFFDLGGHSLLATKLAQRRL